VGAGIDQLEARRPNLEIALDKQISVLALEVAKSAVTVPVSRSGV
jgi:hypothetical protein